MKGEDHRFEYVGKTDRLAEGVGGEPIAWCPVCGQLKIGEDVAFPEEKHIRRARIDKIERALDSLLDALYNERRYTDRDAWFRDELHPAVAWARRELKR